MQASQIQTSRDQPSRLTSKPTNTNTHNVYQHKRNKQTCTVYNPDIDINIAHTTFTYPTEVILFLYILVTSIRWELKSLLLLTTLLTFPTKREAKRTVTESVSSFLTAAYLQTNGSFSARFQKRKQRRVSE